MKEKHTITSATKMLIIGTALFFDGTQFILNFIPVMGQILSFFVNIFAQMTFWLWFKINGVSYGSSKRMATVIGGNIIGFIPIVNSLPELTLQVALILTTLEAEKVAEKLPGAGKMVGDAIKK